MSFSSHLNVANWSQSLSQTLKSHKATSTKTPICLLSCVNLTVTKNPKPVPGKPIGIFLRKTQKVVYVARKRGINLILRENTLALWHMLLLLARPLFLFFPAVIGPPPLCIQCLKSASDVITCSKQTEYHTCGYCNRLYKSCLEVWSSCFGYT